MNYPQVLYPEPIKLLCTSKELPKPAKTDEHSLTPDSSSVVLPTINQSWAKQPSQTTKMLLLTWLVWLIGVVIVVLLGIVLRLPWLSILCFVAAHSCGMALVYFWLTNRYVQTISKRKVQLRDSNPQDAPKHELESESITKPREQRQHPLAQLKLNQVQPIGSSSARAGVSEKQFFDYLCHYFEEVVWGAEFETPWQGRNYSADFLVKHQSSGVGIDVEIDEPYALLSKKPTHCLDSDTDGQRNQFFLERNWIVVRFSERQIVKAPLSCCKVIALVIAEVTGDFSGLELFNSVPDLIVQPAWTKKQAYSMARQDYRLSYLPSSVHPKQKKHKGRRFQ